MTLEPFKFIVQAIMLERDGELVTGERSTDPTALYGASLEQVAAAFDRQLQELVDAQASATAE